jgi:hypothetical protein
LWILKFIHWNVTFNLHLRRSSSDWNSISNLFTKYLFQIFVFLFLSLCFCRFHF